MYPHSVDFLSIQRPILGGSDTPCRILTSKRAIDPAIKSDPVCGLAAAFDIGSGVAAVYSGKPDEHTPVDTRPTRGGPADGYGWINSLDPKGPEPGCVDMTGISIDLALSPEDQVIPVGLPILVPFWGIT